MPEKLQNFLRMLQARLRVIAFIVATAMFGFVFYLYQSESGGIPETGVGGGKSKKVELDRDDHERLEAILARNERPIEETEFLDLLSDSMFSVKAVRDAVEQEEKANEKSKEALRQYQDKEYADAYRLCKEALALRPNHFQARALMKELDKIMDVD